MTSATNLIHELAADHDKTFNKIMQLAGPSRFTVSDNLRNLLSCMLQYDHEDRISVDQALAHPYFLDP